MLRLLGILMLTVLLSGCAEPPYTNVGNAELQRLRDQGVTLIDIRRPDEWRQTGVVAGSKRLTFVDANGRVTPGFLDTLQREVPKDQPVALICRTGNRTDVLARHMVERLGYTSVFNVRDGITEWIRAGLPTTRG